MGRLAMTAAEERVHLKGGLNAQPAWLSALHNAMLPP
jgi:hypothetical protein